MTKINTDLNGRLRNTNLPQSKFLYPLFEAVVNSIYAIDDRIKTDHNFSIEQAFIEVRFIRAKQTSLENEKAKLQKITITDNGIGFTKENCKSFYTLDSRYHASKGCRGVGRLLWLKEFAYAHISSVYSTNKIKQQITFNFSEKGIENEKTSKEDKSKEQKTEVNLCNLKNNYVDLYKTSTLDYITNLLFEHCLWFYLREGGCPCIKLFDDTEEINMDHLYEEFSLDPNKKEVETFDIKGEKFELLHVRLKKSENKNIVAFCAGNRIVMQDKLNLPGLYDFPLNDNGQKFFYQCYVTSTYLDKRVSPDRFSFMIPEQKSKDENVELFDNIYFNDIRNKVYTIVEEYLQPYLKENIEQGEKRIESFVNLNAPFYKPLLSSLSKKEKTINPNSTDKSVDSYLHTKLMEQEHQLIEKGHDILKVRSNESKEEYNERVNDYFNKAQNLKESDLARYVIHRKIILEFLEDSLKVKDGDKYSKEDRVHEIIMPMHRTSDDIEFRDNNLWIINDRLVFHHYLASDKSFKSMKITNSDSIDRPDIMSEFIYDNPLVVTEKNNPPYASFSIIEFKRPMRNDYNASEKGKDPIMQCIDYVKEIRGSKVTDKNGRLLSLSNGTPAYCYIICDLTSKMSELCRDQDFTQTYDGLGYFGYRSNYKIYFEVISFQQLLYSAKERNAAFFDKLGISHD